MSQKDSSTLKSAISKNEAIAQRDLLKNMVLEQQIQNFTTKNRKKPSADELNLIKQQVNSYFKNERVNDQGIRDLAKTIEKKIQEETKKAQDKQSQKVSEKSQQEAEAHNYEAQPEPDKNKKNQEKERTKQKYEEMKKKKQE